MYGSLRCNSGWRWTKRSCAGLLPEKNRFKVPDLILDKEAEPGGSWQHYWKSLRLFSPASFSSLPGTIMPGGADYYPSREETLDYLRKYEEKYQLAIQKSTYVDAVYQQRHAFKLLTDRGTFWSKALVSATGSFAKPCFCYAHRRRAKCQANSRGN